MITGGVVSAVLFSSTPTVLESAFATSRSGLASPFTGVPVRPISGFRSVQAASALEAIVVIPWAGSMKLRCHTAWLLMPWLLSASKALDAVMFGGDVDYVVHTKLRDVHSGQIRG